jgi:diguanylate cyclase (GGDEF)-like protein
MEGFMTPMMGSRAENVVQLRQPKTADRQRLLDWALAAVAEAEERLAALQARVTYLEGISVTDELTGLLNRRGFLAELERALAAARRGGPPGVVMVCDLDGFKRVNDRHGHNVGNEVLKQFARLLAGKVRRADAVGRLGGDEFGVVLNGATLANAQRRAQAVRQLVATTSLVAADASIRLGASFGFVSFYGSEGEEDLLNRADLAMYGEKRRNAELQSA